VTNNFQTGNNKTKLLMEYEIVTQNVSVYCFVVSMLMSRRKVEVVPQNGDCSRESNVYTIQALLATCFQAGLLLGLFFDPEYGEDMLLRNAV
jgi:hypothetical protein